MRRLASKAWIVVASVVIAASPAFAQIEAGKNMGKAIGNSYNKTADKMKGGGATGKSGGKKATTASKRKTSQERYKALHGKRKTSKASKKSSANKG